MDTTKTSKKNRKTSEEQAMNLINRFKHLESQRAPLESSWDEIAKYFMPRKQNINSKSNLNAVEKESRLYDTTGNDALLTSAAGLLSWTTPKSEPWFSFEAPRKLRKIDSVRKWLNECSQIAQELLANSNFYSQRHENLIDKLAFGTSALFSQVTDEGKTYFENVPVGTYVIEENYMGMVDTLMRKIPLTSRQAVQQFGEENLPKEIQECYINNDNKIHTFIHIVKPRTPKEIKNNLIRSADQKPFASIYIHQESATVVKEGGFETFPFQVGRYLSYTGNAEKTAWGYGIGFAALPEARQLNFLQKMMDAATEKMVFPPLLVPNGYEGTLDVQSNGIIFYDPLISNDGPGSISPLQSIGDMSVAMERIRMKQDALNGKFHVDLYQMLNNRVGKQPLSATEVNERIAEKLDSITPAYDQDTAECITPLLQRLFQSWTIAGLLPPPPPEAISAQYEDGSVEIPNPEIIMGGRLSLAIKNLRNKTADAQMMRVSQLATLEPSVLDNIDFDKIVRGTSFDSGFNVEYLKDDKDVVEIREQRAAAQQAQAQQNLLLEAAKVVPAEEMKKLAESQM